MNVLFRISDNGYKKTKLPNATKKDCLLNFLTQWPLQEVTVFVDKVIPETQAWLDELHDLSGLVLVPIEGGSSAGSWRIVRDYALEKFQNNEIVYFVEDDYLHTDWSRKCLLEAMERGFDYVTLYDAPDKYVPGNMGGNPYIDEDGADATKVYLTKSRHWRITNSTTMTFACRVGTLREDLAIWKKWTEENHPHDFQAFLELREKGRILVSPIPSLSTHCEPAWLAPIINWSDV